ncbi:hypothetical protein EW145_g3280 [Phellinidium pouzarii]|uniref:Uncharacterized protein n=1 Tax=Phellinidium pouzarii TaxID=167371 RepID=A0A4S4L7Y4_9AGAM|nr:hypothetical protein EW145_g3280 [Phellinidium pouzarii]
MSPPSVCSSDILEESLGIVFTQAEAMLSVSSISTMATRDDNPGAGRSVGKLISFLGRLTEKVTNRYAERIGYEPRAPAARSASSISTMATTENQPGAGRTLGVPLGYLGRFLERLASRIAEKRGHGPVVVTKNLLTLRDSKSDHSYNPSWNYVAKSSPVSGSAEDQKIRKGVTKLLKYARSQFEANQSLALKCILELAFLDRYIHQVFLELDAPRILALLMLQTEPENDKHLAPLCQKALVCLLDTQINMLGHKVLELSMRLRQEKAPRLGDMGKPGAELADMALQLAEQARRSPSVSFLVMRHIRAALGGLWASKGPFIVPFMQILSNLLERSPHAIEWAVLGKILAEIADWVDKRDKSYKVVQEVMCVHTS